MENYNVYYIFSSICKDSWIFPVRYLHFLWTMSARLRGKEQPVQYHPKFTYSQLAQLNSQLALSKLSLGLRRLRSGCILCLNNYTWFTGNVGQTSRAFCDTRRKSKIKRHPGMLSQVFQLILLINMMDTQLSFLLISFLILIKIYGVENGRESCIFAESYHIFIWDCEWEWFLERIFHSSTSYFWVSYSVSQIQLLEWTHSIGMGPPEISSQYDPPSSHSPKYICFQATRIIPRKRLG